MEKINSILKISELIALDMSGHINQDEKQLLQEWLDVSEQNQKHYKKILTSKNLDERNQLYNSINIEQAWIEVSAKLISPSKNRTLKIVLKYAAAILIPVLLAVTGYWYLNDQPNDIIHPMANIQPGSNNAVLVLANGKSVDLTNDSLKEMIEKDGTVIKNNNKELNYASQDLRTQKQSIMNTLIVPRGGEYHVILSDGTRLFVNSMSKVVFPVKFSGHTREITLVEGEAYFEVTKDKTKPFIVSVKGMKVEVLGTSFNIKAYPDDTYSYTTLVEGKVKLNLNDQPSIIQFLEPDQQAMFNPSSEGIEIQKVDAKQAVQWTKGIYSFTNQTLDEIMKTLSRWYDFDYRYDNEALKQIRFEGSLNKYESIEPIIDIINKTEKVRVSVKGKEIIISKID